MKELEAIYRKRKHQLIPIIFGFTAVFVLFRIVVPQWGDIQEVQSLLTSKNKNVKAKSDSITLLNSITQETIDENFNLVTTAIPLEKDVILIFNELNQIATKTSVKLGGFNVKIGGIYSTDKKPKANQKLVNGVPYVNILVNVSGKGAGLRSFADELYKSIPLVEIKSIDITKTGARYDVNFYYKPPALKQDNADGVPLTSLNGTEVKQLKDLKSWNNTALQ